MDIDKTLRDLRHLIRQGDDDGQLDLSDAAELVELFDALDGWLSGGGFPPSAWLAQPPAARDRSRTGPTSD